MSTLDKTPTANAQVHRLTEASQAMNGIVKLFNDITGQIGVLALNATLESARAGDAGRGFSIIATEMKTLAHQAKKATDKISNEVENLNGISEDIAISLNAKKSTD